MKKWLFVLFFPTYVFSQSSYNYENLVMEGGGVRGLAYAGVFKVLEQKNILQNIENVGGTSAGSIAGMMVAVGYNAHEIDSLMNDLQVQKFNDGKGGIFGKYRRFKKGYGIYKGEEMEIWLKQLLKNKTGNPRLTFEQLHRLHLKDNKFKDLYCTGTNLSKQQLEVFSWIHTPQMPVALAVHISSCIPLYFEPVSLDNQMQKIIKTYDSSFVNYYVDGGLLCNYPICMFDSCISTESNNPLICEKVKFNTKTLGIKLVRPQTIDALNKHSTKIPAYNINNISEYFSAFVNMIMEAIGRRYPNLENEKGRTIYVSQGDIPATVKKTSEKNKRILYKNGYNAAMDFFEEK